MSTRDPSRQPWVRTLLSREGVFPGRLFVTFSVSALFISWVIAKQQHAERAVRGGRTGWR